MKILKLEIPIPKKISLKIPGDYLDSNLRKGENSVSEVYDVDSTPLFCQTLRTTFERRSGPRKDWRALRYRLASKRKGGSNACDRDLPGKKPDS